MGMYNRMQTELNLDEMKQGKENGGWISASEN